MKHTPSQMIWSALLCRCTAGLYFIPPNTTLNGLKYVELLEEKLKLYMHVYGCIIFMLDGAPCLRLKVVTDFPKKNKSYNMAREQPSSPSSRQPVDYYEG